VGREDRLTSCSILPKPVPEALPLGEAKHSLLRRFIHIAGRMGAGLDEAVTLGLAEHDHARRTQNKM